MKHLISNFDLKNDDTQDSANKNGAQQTKVKPISVNTQDAMILVEILQIPTEKRKKEHIQIMKECLSKVKFLQSYQDTQHYNEVLQNLELENWNLDHILFRQGDHADKFYIILNGIIGLYIRTQNDGDQTQKSAQSQTQTQNQPEDKNKQIINDSDDTTTKLSDRSPSKNKRRSTLLEQNDGSQSLNLLGVGVREVARLESGDAFGELGLLFNEDRTATAVCLDSTSLLVLKKEIFEKYLSQSKNAKISIMVDFYTNLWQMRDMQQKEILKLATKTTLTQCTKNTVIIKQGEKPKGIFFVRNGIVKLIATLKFRVDHHTFTILDDYNDPTPQEVAKRRFKTIDVQLDDIGNGNLFADYEVFNNQEIPYTAITNTNCEILTITLQDLKQNIPADVYKQFISSIKHYPSSDKIKRQYIENIMWNKYKNDIILSHNNELVNQIRQNNIFSHRLPFLPKIPLSKYQIYDEISNTLANNKKQQQKEKNQVQRNKSQQTLDNISLSYIDDNFSPEKQSHRQISQSQHQQRLSIKQRESSENTSRNNLKDEIGLDKKATIIQELSHLKQLENQEDQLNSRLIKQANNLQNKPVTNKLSRNDKNTQSIHELTKNTQEVNKSKDKIKISASRSTHNLIPTQMTEERNRNIQNEFLIQQNKMIEEYIQQRRIQHDPQTKINSKTISNSLQQNQKSTKQILPKINKQSKVSLLANEIY